jgi:hypothetical protein
MIVGVLWWFLQPLSEDALFARIQAAATNKDDAAAVLTAEEDTNTYLQRFPDGEHTAVVKQVKEEINLQKLELRFRLRTRLSLSHDESLSPAEYDYLEAMNYLPINPDITASRLQAIIDLYGSQQGRSEVTTECVELAKRELKHLREQSTKASPEYLKMINANLQRARQLQQASPDEAKAIWQSIITLYGDKPWATKQVAEARAALSAADTATNK